MTPADRVTILAATLVALVAMGGVGYVLESLWDRLLDAPLPPVLVRFLARFGI